MQGTVIKTDKYRRGKNHYEQTPVGDRMGYQQVYGVSDLYRCLQNVVDQFPGNGAYVVGEGEYTSREGLTKGLGKDGRGL